MAATIDGDVIHAGIADIAKWEDGPDGSLYVYGKATTPEIDTDEQVVWAPWSGDALKQWLAEAPALRVQHNAQRDPAGSGVAVEVDRDGDGAHWLKAVVDEPVAQRLVKKRHLRAFSVGIAKPVIERDPTGKARNGIIKGGRIIEVSLVDSPANRSCWLEMVKSDNSGHATWSGKVVGDADALLAKDAEPDVTKGAEITGTVRFSPADLAKLLDIRRRAEEREATKAAEPGGDEDGGRNAAEDEKDEPAQPDEGNDDGDDSGKGAAADAAAVAEPDEAKDHREFTAARRRKLAKAGKALPDGSYPIPDKDALRRAAVLARSGHGNVKAARKLIARRARELGVANPLDADDKVKKAAKGTGKTAARAARAACPSCGKKGRGARCGACGEAMTAKAATPGDGVTGEATQAVPAHRGPDSAATEDADKAARGAHERLKSLGVPLEDGRLHDFLCPAYHPDDVAAAYPGATLSSVIDPGDWQGKALAHALEAPLADAHAVMQRWQDAIALKALDATEAGWLRLDAHWKFAEANPGPSSFPAPSHITAERFRRPPITEGHASYSKEQGAPHHAPAPTGQIDAAQFRRPFLAEGEAADSPANHHGASPVTPPSPPGRPQRTFYRNSARDSAREAMARVHDHIAGTFPDLCPMRHDPAEHAQPKVESRPVPVPSGAARKGARVKTAKTARAPEGKPGKMACPSCGKTGRGRFCKSCGKPMKADKGARVTEAVKAALAPLEKRLADQQALIDEMGAAPDPRYAPFKAVGAAGVLAKALAGPDAAKTASNRERLIDELRERVRNEDHPGRREEAWNSLMGLLDLPSAAAR